jgi:hypothetical protein
VVARKTPTSETTASAASASSPIISQVGATFHHQYLERSQQVVAVNKNDLEDLLEFDTSAISFGGFGMFLLSGAFWLLMEKILEAKELLLTPVNAFCSLAVAIGVFLVYQGWRMHSRKRLRIERIFNETTIKPSASATSQGSARNVSTG